MPTRVLFISAEVAPLAKTGGLADVAGALPKTLRKRGLDVRVIMPAYGQIESSLASGNPFDLHPIEGGMLVPFGGRAVPAGILAGQLPGSDVPVYLVAERERLGRPKIYGYSDDTSRFAFFARAALEVCQRIGWQPELVHAHDWHAAPAVTWLDTAGKDDPDWRETASLFTIHNLAHQGHAGWDVIDQLGIQTPGLAEEYPGQVNFMARGIHHASLVNTVSPTYAQEIKTPAQGAGLDGLLRTHAFDLHGVLNGIDTEIWDPLTDPNISSPFGPDTLTAKAANKTDLQRRLDLQVNPDVPMLAMVSRLDWQKGLDISGEAFHRLLNGHAGDAQLVILGTGMEEYETMLAQLANYHPQKMAALLSYDAEFAQRIYAASDAFLMPSRFEPCGLGQLIAMRYASLPIVRKTGGLADTVQDGLNGFSFDRYDSEAYWDAIARALKTYHHDPSEWTAMQVRALQADYSWERSADRYLQLYEWASSRVRGW
jgi:starch synthase